MCTKRVGTRFEKILCIAGIEALDPRNRGFCGANQIAQLFLSKPTELAPLFDEMSSPPIWITNSRWHDGKLLLT